MTEKEWLAEADWQVLHEHVRRRENYARKIRLFCVACCRRIAHKFDEPKCDEAVAVAELFADGEVTGQQLYEAARVAHETIRHTPPFDRAWARGAAWRTARAKAFWEGATACLMAVANTPSEVQAQTALFRDVFRCPARKVKRHPKWLTTDVLALARGIYDDRAFDRMPILADALQDAGCDCDAILSHCRDPQQVHVRGCWVVDLLLGKS